MKYQPPFFRFVVSSSGTPPFFFGFGRGFERFNASPVRRSWVKSSMHKRVCDGIFGFLRGWSGGVGSLQRVYEARIRAAFWAIGSGFWGWFWSQLSLNQLGMCGFIGFFGCFVCVSGLAIHGVWTRSAGWRTGRGCQALGRMGAGGASEGEAGGIYDGSKRTAELRQGGVWLASQIFHVEGLDASCGRILEKKCGEKSAAKNFDNELLSTTYR